MNFNKPILQEELKIVWNKGNGLRVILHQKIHKNQAKCWLYYALSIYGVGNKNLNYTAHEAIKLCKARQLLAEIESKQYWKYYGKN